MSKTRGSNYALPMKIVLAVNSLVQGGAQRFTIELAKALSGLGYVVTILTFYPKETDFFDIPDEVDVFRLTYPFQDNGRVWTFSHRIPGLLALQRKILRIRDLMQLRDCIRDLQPDCVIAVERYVGALVALTASRRVRIIVSERVHPVHHQTKMIFGQPNTFILRKVFNRKNVYLHAQGMEISKKLNEEFNKTVTTIPNFVVSNNFIPEAFGAVKKKVVLSIGRFTYQKGFDLLLDAWSLIPQEERADWILRIIGDGDRDPYFKIAASKSILDSVSLEPAIQKIDSAYNSAQIFVLASRYEGFPNVLAEAMGFGLPSIATDCPSAVRDLTRNGKLATLVDLDQYKIAEALKDLMSSPEKRQKMSDLAVEVLDLFSRDNVLAMWQEFIKFVAVNDPEIKNQCPICLTWQKQRSFIELKTKSQIIRDLKMDWSISAPGSSLSEDVVLRFKCASCGVEFFNAKQGGDDFYEACHASKSYERQSNWDYLRVIEFFGRESLETMTILDVGSGFSRFIGLPLDTVNKLSIVEINQETVDRQVKFIKSAFSDLEEVEGKYQLVMLSHFLEHVDNPRTLIERLATICEENSFVAVTVPDSSFGEYDQSPLDWPPHHTLRFNHKSIDLLFRSFGFQQVYRSYESPFLDLGFDFLTIYRFSGYKVKVKRISLS